MYTGFLIFFSLMLIFPFELLGCGSFFSLIFKNILFFYFNFSFQVGGSSRVAISWKDYTKCVPASQTNWL